MKSLIIGFGSIGKRHADLLNSFENINDVHVISAQKDLPYRTYKEIEEIADLSIFDYFVISKSTSQHYEYLCYLDTKVSGKTILIEKPLFDYYIPFYSNRNKLFIAYNLRFHPLIKYLKKEIEGKEILSVSIITGQYLPEWRKNRDYRESYSANPEMGGGVILDLSHEFDYLTWLFSSVERAFSYQDQISNLQIRSEDMALIMGELTNGTCFSVQLDYISKIPMRQIVVHSNNCSWIVDIISGIIRKKEIDKAEKLIQNKDDIQISYHEMHKSAIEGDPDNNLAKLSDSLILLKMIDSIKKAKWSTYDGE